jgi:hypothetical protein
LIRLFILVLMLLPAVNSYSQILPGGNYDIFERKKQDTAVSFKAYTMIELRIPKLFDEYGYEAGIGVGLDYKHYAIGLNVGTLLSNNIKDDSLGRMRQDLGGLEIIGKLKLNEFISLQAKNIIGFGYARFVGNSNLISYNMRIGDWFFFTEPGIGAFALIANKYQVYGNVSYRIAPSFTGDYFTMKDLSGEVFSVGIKILF